jgi:hypothetical protein
LEDAQQLAMELGTSLLRHGGVSIGDEEAAQALTCPGGSSIKTSNAPCRSPPSLWLQSDLVPLQPAALEEARLQAHEAHDAMLAAAILPFAPATTYNGDGPLTLGLISTAVGAGMLDVLHNSLPHSSPERQRDVQLVLQRCVLRRGFWSTLRSLLLSGGLPDVKELVLYACAGVDAQGLSTLLAAQTMPAQPDADESQSVLERTLVLRVTSLAGASQELSDMIESVSGALQQQQQQQRGRGSPSGGGVDRSVVRGWAQEGTSVAPQLRIGLAFAT